VPSGPVWKSTNLHIVRSGEPSGVMPYWLARWLPLLGPADCSSSRSHSTDNRSAIQQPPEAPRRAIRGICTTLPGSRCASRAVALGGRSARPNATSAPLRHRGLSVATEAALEAKESKQPGYRCGLPTRILPARNAHFAEALKREDLCEGLSEAKARGIGNLGSRAQKFLVRF
jgi:hypothetical protein